MMTMPKTAKVVRELSGEGAILLPEHMDTIQLGKVIEALQLDLSGDPIGYIRSVAPSSKFCECGALHLALDDSRLSAETARSLTRVLATPFGEYIRECFKREHGYESIRFGWSSIEAVAPSFMKVVDMQNVRAVDAADIPDEVLREIIEALQEDVPGVMGMLDRSVELAAHQSDGVLSSWAVSPDSLAGGSDEWRVLIDQVMFAWSTPTRKYLDEYLRRRGMVCGAVNCCIISTMRGGSAKLWRNQWFAEQTAQQLTPDC